MKTRKSPGCYPGLMPQSKPPQGRRKSGSACWLGAAFPPTPGVAYML
jgi:hypothetical protein